MPTTEVATGGGRPEAGLHRSRMTLPRRGARLTTTLAVRSPKLWRLLRPPVRRYFDLLAPRWDAIVGPGPFIDELERVLAPQGTLLVSFAEGPDTPIWVPAERLRGELAQRGFARFAEFAAGAATCLLARRAGERIP